MVFVSSFIANKSPFPLQPDVRLTTFVYNVKKCIVQAIKHNKKYCDFIKLDIGVYKPQFIYLFIYVHDNDNYK